MCNLTKQVILYIDETVHWQHLKQCINIYLHWECCKASFICCFVTTENLIWPVVFYFSVHSDQQRNNLYLQHWLYVLGHLLSLLQQKYCYKLVKYVQIKFSAFILAVMVCLDNALFRSKMKDILIKENFKGC